jgi:hypothetical protein
MFCLLSIKFSELKNLQGSQKFRKLEFGQLYLLLHHMTKKLKGEENTSIKPQRYWQLRVASLILFALIGAGVLVALNSAYNVGALLIAGGVLGQLFLTQLRDESERNFRSARAEREDFEKDRDFQLRQKELLLRAIEIKFQIESSRLNAKEKEKLNNLLSSSDDEE